MMTKLLNVLGMLLLGLAALIGFAALVQWRVGQPLPGAPVAAAGAPLGQLEAGIAGDFETVIELLGRQRSEALHALDAARRAAMLGRALAPDTFDPLHRAAALARHAVQRGDADAAVALLQRALTQRGTTMLPAPTPPDALDRYVGATVIDARGRRLGDVAAVLADERGPLLRLHRGAHADWFGFVDIGRGDLELPADALLYGAVEGTGATLVCAPGGLPDA